MRPNNTMPRSVFISFHVFWTIVVLMWYRIIFRNLEGFSTAQSVTILFCILFLSLVTGIMLTIKRQCNCVSLAVNVAIPYGIYTIISYGMLMKTVTICTLVLIAVLSAICIFFTVRPIPKNHIRRKLIRKVQLMRSFLEIRKIAAVCMSLVILPMIVNAVFGNPFFNFNEKEPVSENDSGETYTIADNIEILTNLENDKWDTLTNDEKFVIVEIIKNIEVSFLGIPHDIDLKVDEMSDLIAAYYMDSERSITINENYFNEASGREMLHLICHEVYHAYQHRLCDTYDSVDKEYRNMLVFDSVENYKHEFSNYISSEEDFEKYDSQAIEVNADAYADDAVGDYFRKINVYLYGYGDE